MGMFSLLLLASQAALNPIVVKGTGLYDSVTQKRFYMKGVAYSPDLYANAAAGGTATPSLPGADHISDDQQASWSKDIPYLAALNINTVRIYNVDPQKGHGLFMKALEDRGIYAIISATATVGPGVLDSGKASPDCYTPGLVASAREIVKAFARYNNTLAFVTGNEIGNEVDIGGGKLQHGYQAMPCVKALTRDLRKYMERCSCSMRHVPLMYAATDFAPVGSVRPRDIISQYLTCGPDAVDIYGVNIYTWCSRESTYDVGSTYKDVTEAYKFYAMPMMFSEYGCNVGHFESPYPFSTNQRTWKQVATLLTTPMSDVWVGGIAYQYSMSNIDFGMVLLPGYQANQPNIVKLANFDSLAGQYGTVQPPSFTGDWTESDRCTWTDPAFSSRVPNICPNTSTVQALFASGKITAGDNWNTNLPTLSNIPNVDCDFSDVGAVVLAENTCKKACMCQNIFPNPDCQVDWHTRTPSSDEIGQLFTTQCTEFAQSGSDYADTCADTDADGKYGGCTTEQKANYLLGVWSSKVRNTCCTTTPCHTITPSDKVTITTQPQSVTTDWRGTARFAITASSGLQPYTYQWQKDFTNFPGATTYTLNLDNVDTAMAGAYRCVVKDSRGWVAESDVATLTVGEPDQMTVNVTLSGTGATTNAFMDAKVVQAFLKVVSGIVLPASVRANDVSIQKTMGGNGGRLIVLITLLLGGPSKGQAATIQTLIKQSYESGQFTQSLAALNMQVESTAAVCGNLAVSPDNHATATCTGTTEGSTCDVACDPGYTAASGDEHRQCQSGQWIGKTLVCTPVDSPKKNGFPIWAIVVIVLVIVAIAATVSKVLHARHKAPKHDYLALQGQ